MKLQEKTIKNFQLLTNSELSTLQGGKGVVIIDHDELDGVVSKESLSSMGDTLEGIVVL